MNNVNKLKNNVYKNYIFIILRNLDLTNGLWMIYLASKGMSLLQLGILEGIYHISSFLMEVPTGMIADIYGRKTSRIMGRCVSVIGTLLMLFTSDFYMFALSFVFAALANNLESGAGDALLYDSLKELEQEARFIKVNGRNEMLYQFGHIIAFPIAGYFADKNFDMVFAASCVIALISAVFSFSFIEPEVGKIKREKRNPFVLLYNQLKESINVLKNRKKIAFLIVFIEVILTLSTTMFYYLQNYWAGLGYTKFKITLVFCIGAAAAAITALAAYKIEKALKEKRLLMIMPMIAIACIWGIALTQYSQYFYIVINVVESVLVVVTMDYINKMIPSENRATILSMSSMLFSFFMILLFPVVGRIGDVISLNAAFIMMAVLGTILLVFNTGLLIFRNKEDK